MSTFMFIISPNVWMLVFPLIFPAAGLVLFATGVRLSWSRVTLTLDGHSFGFEARCLGWRKSASIPRTAIDGVNFAVSQNQNKVWLQFTYLLWVSASTGENISVDDYLRPSECEWLWSDLRSKLAWPTGRQDTGISLRPKTDLQDEPSRIKVSPTPGGHHIQIAPGQEFRWAVIAGGVLWFVGILAMVVPSFLYLAFAAYDDSAVPFTFAILIWAGMAIGVAGLWTGLSFFIIANRARTTSCEIRVCPRDNITFRTVQGKNEWIEKISMEDVREIITECIWSKIEETAESAHATSLNRGLVILRNRVISFGTGANVLELKKAVRILREALPRKE